MGYHLETRSLGKGSEMNWMLFIIVVVAYIVGAKFPQIAQKIGVV